jgi:hypothetical protein
MFMLSMFHHFNRRPTLMAFLLAALFCLPLVADACQIT